MRVFNGSCTVFDIGGNSNIRNYRGSQQQKKVFIKSNMMIKAEKVRLIDEDGKQIGIVPLHQALKKAQEKELDLIEISSNTTPPVCKIIAFDKYKYELQQKEKKAKKHQKETELKEFRLKLNIFKTDLDTRIRRIDEFLKKGNKIKITVQFRGRENAKKALGYELVQKILDYFGDKIEVEKEPVKQGNLMICIISSKKTGSKNKELN